MAILNPFVKRFTIQSARPVQANWTKDNHDSKPDQPKNLPPSSGNGNLGNGSVGGIIGEPLVNGVEKGNTQPFTRGQESEQIAVPQPNGDPVLIEPAILPGSGSTGIDGQGSIALTPDGSRVPVNDERDPIATPDSGSSDGDSSVTSAVENPQKPNSQRSVNRLQRVKDNIDALELVYKTGNSDFSFLDKDQKIANIGILRKYTGWGGLTQVFNENDPLYENDRILIKQYVGEDGYAAARASILNAYFTSDVVTDAIHQSVTKLGVVTTSKTRFLEPSTGSGVFIERQDNSHLPVGEKPIWVGVELDKTSARIAQLINADAKIINSGFEKIDIPDGYFDVALGNPPYGQDKIVDQNPSAYSNEMIHNYFICKSMAQLRPGGLLSMVVTRSFLDGLDESKNEPFQNWLKENARLVSAVRLPGAAFSHTGTAVISDIIILQKMPDPSRQELGQKNEDHTWLNRYEKHMINPKDGTDISFNINSYYKDHPENILGVEMVGSNQFGPSYDVHVSNDDWHQELNEWVARLPQGVYKAYDRSDDKDNIQDIASNLIPNTVVGNYFVDKESNSPTFNKVFQRIQDSMGERRAVSWNPVNAKADAKMRLMIDIRETLVALMSMEHLVASTVVDENVELKRVALNEKVDEFHEKYGFFNDAVNRNIFFEDTQSQLLLSLEFNYEKAIGAAKAQKMGIAASPAKAKKADILDKRVIFPSADIEDPKNPKDALIWSLTKWGQVKIENIAHVLSSSIDEVVADLGGLIFRDTENPAIYRSADDYLSGDVKTKLEQAQNAMKAHPLMGYERNFQELSSVIPVDRLPSQIHAPIGASWLPPEVIRDFCYEITGISNYDWTYIQSSATWVRGDSWSSADYSLMYFKYGTNKLSAIDIFDRLISLKTVEVKKQSFDDKGQKIYITDEGQTELARVKADAIDELWNQWLWADPKRSGQLVKIYNEKFNRVVSRKFDGSHINLFGSSTDITLLDHQKNAIWRGISTKSLLLDHVVGAGKTYCMTAIAMEMKRLGIVRKPLFVVPNHLTMEWKTAFLQLYPGANVLAATPDDFEVDKRKSLFSKIAIGQWDAVIVGHSSLARIEIGNDFMYKLISSQVQDVLDEIKVIKESKKRSSGRSNSNDVRELERMRKSMENKLLKIKNKTGKKDDLLTFDQFGVDAMIIDELHEFKNLFFTTKMTRIAGLGNPEGSGKALDLLGKIRYLQSKSCPIISATGTPVSNSLAEMFTMQRYMDYDGLAEDKLNTFDSWVRQYAKVETLYEVAPSGVGYRTGQRLSKFKNLPQLMTTYAGFSDVITLSDLKQQEINLGRTFPIPKVRGGKPHNVVAKRSQLQQAYFGIPQLDFNDDGLIKFDIDATKPWSIEEVKSDSQEPVDPAKKYALKCNGSGDVDYPIFGAVSYHASMDDAYEEFISGVMSPKIKYDDESLLGKFSRIKELTKETKGQINALTLTGLANKCGLDYRIIDPTAPDFADSKINIAIQNICSLHKKWEKQKGTQIVFCDLSVPHSEKSRSELKDKICIIRSPDGDITSLNGTLHTVPGFDEFPFYVVKTKSDNQVDQDGKKVPVLVAYDPFSGMQIMKSQSLIELKNLVKQVLSTDQGKSMWCDIQNSQALITQGVMDEYLIDNELMTDTRDNFFSEVDVWGASSSTKFSVYDDMRSKLIAKGVSENEIAFIHDYDTPLTKSMLFRKVNSGEIRVLFGSTAKLGAGTNVQELLVGAHHIDAPWRPSDLEQREGRIIRRGNKLYENDPDGFEVSIYRYATEQTYDTRRWQLLEHKASGIEQLRQWKSTDGSLNEIDDIVGGEAANSAEMKSCASGNPLVLRETKLNNEIKRIKSIISSEADTRYQNQNRLVQLELLGKSIQQKIEYSINLLKNVKSKRSLNEPIHLSSLGVTISDEHNKEKLDFQKTDDIIKTVEKDEKVFKEKNEPSNFSKLTSLCSKILDNAMIMGRAISLSYDGIDFKVQTNQSQPGTFKLLSPDGDDSVFKNSSVTLLQRLRSFVNPEYVESNIQRLNERFASVDKSILDTRGVLNSPVGDNAKKLEECQSEYKDVRRALMRTSVLTLLSPVEKDVLNDAQAQTFGYLTATYSNIDWKSIDAKMSNIAQSLISKKDAVKPKPSPTNGF